MIVAAHPTINVQLAMLAQIAIAACSSAAVASDPAPVLLAGGCVAELRQ